MGRFIKKEDPKLYTDKAPNHSENCLSLNLPHPALNTPHMISTIVVLISHLIILVLQSVHTNQTVLVMIMVVHTLKVLHLGLRTKMNSTQMYPLNRCLLVRLHHQMGVDGLTVESIPLTVPELVRVSRNDTAHQRWKVLFATAHPRDLSVDERLCKQSRRASTRSPSTGLLVEDLVLTRHDSRQRWQNGR